MKMKTIVIAVALAVLLVGSVYAGNGRRIGTAGAHELTIPVGSRGTAMGGAVVANSYGVESMFWNPAGLAMVDAPEVMFSHQMYLADIDINFGGAAVNIEGFGTIALAAKVVAIGEMEETTQEQPYGTGRTFDPTLSVLSLSYARQLTNRVAFGATFNYIREDIFEVDANGVAFDIGFLYESGWNGLNFGFAIKNYGPEMSFSGRGFERATDGRPTSAENATFDLPSSLNFGVAYPIVNMDESRLQLSGNFRSNNYSEDYWQGGAEYSFQDRYFLRAGYNFADQDEWIYGASLGGGVNIDLGGTNLSFEYSWTETDVFDDNQFFTVKAAF